MNADPWLDRWLPAIHAPKRAPMVLELGCGECWDTAYLLHLGYRVVATDIQLGRCRLPSAFSDRAYLVRHDMRQTLPFADGQFTTIIASLCLHYFGCQETERIVAELHRCLDDEGRLLCRLNSTRDVNFGAAGYPVVDSEVAGAYSQLRRRRKRFFDEASVIRLFQHSWSIESLSEQTIRRYRKPKVVWEVILRRNATSDR